MKRMGATVGIWLLAFSHAQLAHADLDGGSIRPGLNSPYIDAVRKAASANKTVQFGNALGSKKDDLTAEYEKALLRALKKNYGKLSAADAERLAQILKEKNPERLRQLLIAYAREKNLPPTQFAKDAIAAQEELASDPTLAAYTTDSNSAAGPNSASRPSPSSRAAIAAANKRNSNSNSDVGVKANDLKADLGMQSPDFKVGAANRVKYVDPSAESAAPANTNTSPSYDNGMTAAAYMYTTTPGGSTSTNVRPAAPARAQRSAPSFKANVDTNSFSGGGGGGGSGSGGASPHMRADTSAHVKSSAPNSAPKAGPPVPVVKQAAQATPAIAQKPISSDEAQSAYSSLKYWFTLKQNMDAQGLTPQNSAAYAHAAANVERYSQLVDRAPTELRGQLIKDSKHLAFNPKTDCNPKSDPSTNLWPLFAEAANRGENLRLHGYEEVKHQLRNIDEHPIDPIAQSQASIRRESFKVFTTNELNIVRKSCASTNSKDVPQKRIALCQTAAFTAFMNNTLTAEVPPQFADPVLRCERADNKIGPVYAKLETSLRDAALKCGSPEAAAAESTKDLFTREATAEIRFRKFNIAFSTSAIPKLVESSVLLTPEMRVLFGSHFRNTDMTIPCDQLRNAYRYIVRLVSHKYFLSSNFNATGSSASEPTRSHTH